MPKNPKEGFSYYLRAVKRDVTIAYYAVGLCYQNGTGTSVDISEAVRYFKMGITKGDADCALAIAKIFEEGIEVKIDYAKARKYLQKASSMGSAKGEFLLGYLMENGLGGEEDVTAAVSLYRSAGEREGGFTDALCALAWCHMNGIGVERNLEEGKRLYRLAESKGDRDATTILRQIDSKNSSAPPVFHANEDDDDDDMGGLFD